MSESLPNLQNSNNQSLSTQEQTEHFKSIYYLLKAKRDTDIKLFGDNKHFRKADITELNDSIFQKLRTLDLVTQITTVTVTLSNREIKFFGNWNEFINTNWNISATTKSITIEWDFNFLFPNQRVPQTHTIRVRIGSDLRPNEIIHVIFQGGDESELEEAKSQVVCKIDFVNAQICSELKMIVNDWYEALPSNTSDHGLIIFLIKYKLYLKNIVSVLMLTSVLIFLNYFVISFLNDQQTSTDSLLRKFYFLSTITILLTYISISIGRLIAENMISKSIGKFVRNPMFQFTKGDENKLAEVKNKNKKYIQNFIISVLLALLTNVIAYLIGLLIPSIANIIN